jgi:cytochrome d ubiquinol oxidase subunit II
VFLIGEAARRHDRRLERYFRHRAAIAGAAAGALSLAALVALRGWGVAQYPTLLPGTGLTLSNGSAPHATLVAVIAVFILAVVLVVPGFLLLFWLHGRQLLESDAPPTMP